MTMELASAVNRLLHEGRSLSFYELVKVLPPHVSVRYKRVINEFKRLKQEAEDEMQAVLREQAVTCCENLVSRIVEATTVGAMVLQC